MVVEALRGARRAVGPRAYAGLLVLRPLAAGLRRGLRAYGHHRPRRDRARQRERAAYLRGDRRGRLLRARLRPCPGPPLADADAAPRGSGPAFGAFRDADAEFGRILPPSRPLYRRGALGARPDARDAGRPRCLFARGQRLARGDQRRRAGPGGAGILDLRSRDRTVATGRFNRARQAHGAGSVPAPFPRDPPRAALAGAARRTGRRPHSGRARRGRGRPAALLGAHARHRQRHRPRRPAPARHSPPAPWRLERLGRCPVPLGHRRHASGERPAPRLLRPGDLVSCPDRARDRGGHRRHDPGHPRRARRPQRRPRLGADGVLRRRSGYLHRSAEPRGPRRGAHAGRLGADANAPLDPHHRRRATRDARASLDTERPGAALRFRGDRPDHAGGPCRRPRLDGPLLGRHDALGDHGSDAGRRDRRGPRSGGPRRGAGGEPCSRRPYPGRDEGYRRAAREEPRPPERGAPSGAGLAGAESLAGNLPPGANPTFPDPPGGIVANTNNKTVDRPFPRHLSFYWGDTQRIQRLTRLLQSREVHTRESFIEAQLDTVSPAARGLLPLLGRDLWFTGEAAPEGTAERRRQRALELLADWNGEMNEHFPEPLIYAAWVRAVQERLIRDELGPMAADFTQVEPVFIERVFRDIDGAGAWCDVIQSAPEESCADIASLALDDALLFVSETWGESFESLRWGDAHEAAHDHPVLGDVPGLNWVVNIRQSTSGGDFTLMRGQTAGRGPNPFLSTHGAGYRGVYDFADPDSSVFIIATGQSGHPLSRHYDDLGELWRRGEYVPMSLDPELARAAAVGVTRLEVR